MGIFGGDSKSSTTSTDNKVNVTDLVGSDVVNLSGLSLGNGRNSRNINTISILDGGAIKSSFQFAESANANAYDFSRDVAKSAADSVGQAVAAVSESARTETENIFINLQKYALYGAIIWGAVQIFKVVK